MKHEDDARAAEVSLCRCRTVKTHGLTGGEECRRLRLTRHRLPGHRVFDNAAAEAHVAIVERRIAPV